MNELKRRYLSDVVINAEAGKTYYNADEVDTYIKERLPEDCVWRWVDNRYKTTCKARTGSLYVDSIAEHNMKFCPYCRGKITTPPTEAET